VTLAISAGAVGSALAVILRIVVAETTERWWRHGPCARAVGAAAAVGAARALGVAAA
jgi:hypothetical protein